MTTIKFGKYKGKNLNEIPNDYIMWLIENTDVDHPKFGAMNRDLVKSLHAELNRRADDQTIIDSPKPVRTQQKPSNAKSDSPIKKAIRDLRGLIDKIYGHADEAREKMDEIDPPALHDDIYPPD